MIDLEQTIEKHWISNTKKYYEEKGYKYTKMGDSFEVKLYDVTKGSQDIVVATCDLCGNQYYPIYGNYNRYHQRSMIDCCGKCAIPKGKATIRNDILEQQWEKLERVMVDKGYKLISTPNDYKNSKSKIIYSCPIHGVQNSIYNNIMRGHGCYKCGKEAMANNQKKLVDEVISAIEKDGNKLLNPEEYDKVTIHNLHIECACGNDYITSYVNYSKGYNRCRKCSNKMSKNEKKIYDYLNELGINFDYEYKFDDLRDHTYLYFDFYLFDYNMCIEFDGEQHFNDHYFKTINPEDDESFETLKKHDQMKDDYCKNKGIELLRIPYWKQNHIREIIDEKLKELDERYSLVS